VTLRHALRGGLSRTLPALARVNQPDGFDCPGCAWPESPGRGPVEFCENGAKAVAHEATRRRVGADFFARHPIPELLGQSGRWLEARGRLAEPVLRRRGSDRYEPVSWDEAFARAARGLRGLASPDRAVFYASGRTSNEAAFLWQLFVREFGTNNLPDCSDLCHEASGHALGEMIGVGKGTVGLADFEQADLVLVIGQNPGTNHPRMLVTLQEAARRGCRIVSINPLRERGLVRFRHPQELRGMLGRGTALAERFVQVRVGGDVPLLQGVMKELLALEAERPGRVLDQAFIDACTEGFEAWRAALDAVPMQDCVGGSGVPRETMRELAELYAASERTIACWAMGLTQHRFGVDNVRQVMNLLLLRGNVGRPGAGPCPVRGHSNVQGDRTMGIVEEPKPAFLGALAREFGFEPPRRPGLNTVQAIRAMAEGRVDVFLALGGNFAVATPDTAAVEAALARCRLTLHVATTLNRSHLVTGEEAILLPCLARSERDVQASGPQTVTVEDSMSTVHASRGRLAPAAPSLRSEVAVVAGLARAVLGPASRVPWEDLSADYRRIRERIARVVPGFERFEERLAQPGGFVLPSGARTRRFETASGRARFAAVELPRLEPGPGQLVLMTVRSHDQFNTTVYDDDDRYRGVHGDRRVVLVHARELARRGLAEGDAVDVTSHFAGETRRLRGFRVRAYDVPEGCAVAYFPEANALVAVGDHDRRSFTPGFKSVLVNLARAAG
jgi:molybdopterin-dependent oxidoreductase alpha subunit